MRYSCTRVFGFDLSGCQPAAGRGNQALGVWIGAKATMAPTPIQRRACSGLCPTHTPIHTEVGSAASEPVLDLPTRARSSPMLGSFKP